MPRPRRRIFLQLLATPAAGGGGRAVGPPPSALQGPPGERIGTMPRPADPHSRPA
ncbi:unnamed protein product [Spirodela intermedia]|uniref:Uncharacterized protein n=1 Tax=Spirodela intermedia TaxID=51605 RepID=A0A7I8KI02_SPIIN|nr:unnamed protein product [Spirodela intermedia]